MGWSFSKFCIMGVLELKSGDWWTDVRPGVEVDGHESILEAAIASGIENMSYDCKMGVCMTCPSRVMAGLPITQFSHQLILSALAGASAGGLARVY